MYGAGGQKRVPDDFVRDFTVALPPLPEQTAIAAFLDRETAKIDALVAEQRRLIDLLKEKRQAVISHAVTKGLNPNAALKPKAMGVYTKRSCTGTRTSQSGSSAKGWPCTKADTSRPCACWASTNSAKNDSMPPRSGGKNLPTWSTRTVIRRC